MMLEVEGEKKPPEERIRRGFCKDFMLLML